MNRLIVVLCLLFAVGCTNNVKEIPPGFVGKILTPTGWDSRIFEAGQVDLGVRNTSTGTYNTLVLLEATSATVKEQFSEADAPGNTDKQDHRVFTRDKVPLAVDFYVRALVPTEAPDRNAIFAQITPADREPWVKQITVAEIYSQMATMDVRGKVRGVFASYNSYQDIYDNYQKVSDTIAGVVSDTFKANGVPLVLQNAQLSNVKPDASVWAVQNQNAGASSLVDTINQIGTALRNNPEYVEYMKWEALPKMSESANSTVIVTDGSVHDLAPLAYTKR